MSEFVRATERRVAAQCSLDVCPRCGGSKNLPALIPGAGYCNLIFHAPDEPHDPIYEQFAAFDAKLDALFAAIEQLRAALDARDLASMAFARDFAREVTPE